jgi:uncharacterized protein YbjQ (UPF0145 family)
LEKSEKESQSLNFLLFFNSAKQAIMILTTTNTVEGKPIQQYLGIVTGETIIGANVIKDFMAGLTDFFGGRSGAYEKVLQEGRNESLAEMKAKAAAMGADAIVGIDLDFETVGRGSMLMVIATGTAVKF